VSFAECLLLFAIMLSDILLSVVKHSVIILSYVMLSDIFAGFVKLCVIILRPIL